MQKHDLHKEHVNDDGANDLSNCVPACYSSTAKNGNSVLRTGTMKATKAILRILIRYIFG